VETIGVSIEPSIAVLKSVAGGVIALFGLLVGVAVCSAQIAKPCESYPLSTTELKEIVCSSKMLAKAIAERRGSIENLPVVGFSGGGQEIRLLQTKDAKFLFGIVQKSNERYKVGDLLVESALIRFEKKVIESPPLCLTAARIDRSFERLRLRFARISDNVAFWSEAFEFAKSNNAVMFPVEAGDLAVLMSGNTPNALFAQCTP
jgi:hypothetical protein